MLMSPNLQPVLCCCPQVSAFDVESVKRRRQIADMVTGGNIDGAISATEQLAPGTLNKSPSILFRLHVQVFLEMVRLLLAQLLSHSQLSASPCLNVVQNRHLICCRINDACLPLCICSSIKRSSEMCFRCVALKSCVLLCYHSGHDD